jgi:uncharacterized protein DUF3465
VIRDVRPLTVPQRVTIDKRVPVATADDMVVHGEYVWNDQGGLTHFTHHDPDRSHQFGWIELKSVRYN